MPGVKVVLASLPGMAHSSLAQYFNISQAFKEVSFGAVTRITLLGVLLGVPLLKELGGSPRELVTFAIMITACV